MEPPTRHHKQLVPLLVLGPVGAGRSTLVGNLIFHAGGLDKRTRERFIRDGVIKDDNYFVLLQILKDMRDRSITIDIPLYTFCSGNQTFSVVEAQAHPGAHCGLMSRPPSSGNVAIVMISAAPDELASSMTELANIILYATLHAIQIVIVVNKIDRVDWSEERFNVIASAVRKLLHARTTWIDVAMTDVLLLPCTATLGDNLINSSPRLSWWKGPTLLQALDSIAPQNRSTRPLRVVISAVYKVSGVGVVVACSIIAGTLQRGTEVMIAPLGVVAVCLDIEIAHTSVESARAGEQQEVAIHLKANNLTAKDIQIGMVLGSPHDPPLAVESFVALIVVLTAQQPIVANYSPILNRSGLRVPCRIDAILSCFNRHTGTLLEQPALHLHADDAALVRLVPLKPLVVERYADSPELACISLRDRVAESRMSAVGVIRSVIKSQESNKTT